MNFRCAILGHKYVAKKFGGALCERCGDELPYAVPWRDRMFVADQLIRDGAAHVEIACGGKMHVSRDGEASWELALLRAR